MYLWGVERGQRARLIFGGDPDPAGRSPRAKLCQGTWLGSHAESTRGCGHPAARSKDKAAAGDQRRGRGAARQTASDPPLGTVSA